MRIPLAIGQAEIIVKKSRFIAIAEPVENVQEMKQRIIQMRNEHPQAAHVVHAAIFGRQGTEFSYSDDHEPKNTAGRPMLEVLKGSQLTNILVMVIRYFGGTLLGTGGLVKAYSEATKAVLEHLPSEELIDRVTFTAVISYDIFEQTKLLIEEYQGSSKEEFAEDITLEITLPVVHQDALMREMTNISHGNVVFHSTES
ncbi:MAG: IMPACT family protein [Sphaerochaetaceae bacterium]|jgi:uncharacterized YigZ family protein